MANHYTCRLVLTRILDNPFGLMFHSRYNADAFRFLRKLRKRCLCDPVITIGRAPW